MSNAKAQPGVGVDAGGGAVIDPTANVIALVEAETKRQDDLRASAKELSDTKHAHQQEIGALRETYQEKIQRAEAGRLDSIRQVDREEVAKTAVAANTAIMTLAKQTTDLQQTLAKQVTDTAAAQEARYSAQYSDTNKRLSALELASSEGKGKQTLSDPQMAEVLAEVKILREARTSATGHQTGGADTWKWVALLIGVIASVLLILSRIP